MTGRNQDYRHWARVAEEWIEWARAPNHDAFWAYRAALVDFIGRGEGDAIEIGCGEGRVSRVLRECGYRVTATDPAAPFVSAAELVGSADHYSVASATDLPFEGESFGVAVAYNVLMDVDDVPAALREIKRILRASGTLLISIVHPFADRGRFAGQEPDAPFVLQASYFGRKRFAGVEEHGGLRMHFAGWSQPLQNYMAALEGAGLAITSLLEPVPDADSAWSHLLRWRRVPMFLWLKARPIPG